MYFSESSLFITYPVQISMCFLWRKYKKMLFTKDYEEYFFIVFQRDNTVIASSPCLSFAVV